MMIQSPDLSALAGIRHGFFTRKGGVSGGIYASLNGGLGSGDERALVVENRARMAGALGVEASHLVSVHQVHSPDVVHVTAPFTGERPKADAMVTDVAGLALAIATADCGPILFADPHAKVIGAAHAGWKGAFGGVIEATVTAMEGLGAARSRIIAVLGPTIGPSAYEVGPEFVERLVGQDAGFARFFAASPHAGHAMFDLPAFIAMRAAEAGIGHFVDLGLCTYSDEARFYSYRRATHRKEADYGRLIAAIAM
jgi:polyphenol oxidase